MARKKQQKHIVLIVDMSGSMKKLRAETVSGVNGYIADRKRSKQPTTLTLILFNSTETIMRYNAAPMAEVKPIGDEYKPNMWTPLLDTVGMAINETETAVTGKTNDVLVMIVTDGLENRSTEFSSDDIRRMIKEKEDAGWTFGYMGANHDAWAASRSMGIAAGNTMRYEATPDGTERLYRAYAAEGTQRWEKGARGQSANLFVGNVPPTVEGVARRVGERINDAMPETPFWIHGDPTPVPTTTDDALSPEQITRLWNTRLFTQQEAPVSPPLPRRSLSVRRWNNALGGWEITPLTAAPDVAVTPADNAFGFEDQPDDTPPKKVKRTRKRIE